MSPVYQPPAAAGGGAVATDVIWDTKGDLAAATGADAAVKVAAGADGTALIADAASTAGVKWNVPVGTQITKVDYTADVTISATTEGTANTVVTAAAFTPNGTDSFWIEFSCPQSVPANADFIIGCIYDNGSFLWRMFAHSASTSNNAVINPKILVTPSNASHTYSIRAFRGGTNGTLKAGAGGSGVNPPGFINIYKAT